MLRLDLKSAASATFVAALSLVAPALTAVPASAQERGSGVLLLAHGGSQAWNERVTEVAQAVDATTPTEVAFGMASRATIDAGITKLKARGVTSIVVVPLFVSSHSSVVTSSEYLLGLRAEAPADLAIFAKMNHGGGHGAPAAAAAGHDASHDAHAAAPDPASPIAVGVPVRMTPAFNRHPLVGAIVADRAKAMSTDPAKEAVILVAHGPVPEDDNRKWLDDMTVLAASIRAAAPFAAVDVLTVRDDAGPAIRDAATADLRKVVSGHLAAGRRVLLVPHLMSFGGIEVGIRKRLDGLDYTMAAQALLPDRRVAEWVRASVAAAPSQK